MFPNDVWVLIGRYSDDVVPLSGVSRGLFRLFRYWSVGLDVKPGRSLQLEGFEGANTSDPTTRSRRYGISTSTPTRVLARLQLFF